MTQQPPEHLRWRRTKLALSSLALLLGLVTIVVTLTSSGGGITSRGVLLGALLAVMAGARLALTLRVGI